MRVVRLPDLFAVAFLIVTAGTVQAGMIGDTVNGSTSSSPPWEVVPGSAVVTDPGVEFGLVLQSTFRAFDVDFGDSTIDFDVLISVGNIGGLGPVTFSDIDWVGEPTVVITGFQFSTDITGMDASRLSFTDHSFSANFDGLTTAVGQFLDVTLETNQAVPEPSSLALLGMGITGLCGYRIRRKRHQAA